MEFEIQGRKALAVRPSKAALSFLTVNH